MNWKEWNEYHENMRGFLHGHVQTDAILARVLAERLLRYVVVAAGSALVTIGVMRFIAG
jgi:hypothetical protein